MVTARFRTGLHASWSVFFDYLEVPWAYAPETFRAADGTACTPAFWLPREGVWFAAEPESAPPWWGRFTAAVSNREAWEPWTEPDGQDVTERPPNRGR